MTETVADSQPSGTGCTAGAPLISIITVVFNGSATLQATLDSVAAQSFQDYEYIVVDGGSTDGTLAILRSNGGVVTRWISEPDAGIYDAMNKGVALTAGRWLYFIGANDTLSNSLAQVAPFLQDPQAIYYGNVYRPVADRIYDGHFSALKLAARNICHQAIFYPRAVWSRYRYDTRYPIYADYDLNMRCYADPSLRLVHIPVTVAVFVDADGVSATRRDPAFEHDRLVLVRRHFPRPVYWATAARLGFLGLLARMRFDGPAMRLYHAWLRLQGRSKR